MSLEDFVDEITMDSISDMIDHLRNKAFVPYATLANPAAYTAEMLTHVNWPIKNPSEEKKKVKMTVQTATMFLVAAREVLAERAAPPSVVPPNSGSTAVQPNTAANTAANTEDLVRAKQMQYLIRVLNALFPWMVEEGGSPTVFKLEPGGGRMHNSIGITTNKEIRNQICEVTPWQTAKTAMGSYDAKRQEAWDRLGRPPYGKDHQALLRDDLPVSLENMPRIVADEVYKWFWEVYGELLLLWIQASLWTQCHIMFTQDSIRATIAAGQHRLQRHVGDKRPSDKSTPTSSAKKTPHGLK